MRMTWTAIGLLLTVVACSSLRSRGSAPNLAADPTPTLAPGGSDPGVRATDDPATPGGFSYDKSFVIVDPTTLAAIEDDVALGRLLDAIDQHDVETGTTGRYRLIAVVNRMDVAGDMDPRGGQLGGAERRWFGEGRLVFGLDKPSDAPALVPMTFTMEYRLPALTKDAGGTIIADPSFDLARPPASIADWIARRKLWAELWAGLSAHALGSPAYVAALRRIVALFTPGNNHVALRTGEPLRAGATGAFSEEREYGELRRESFLCSQSSILDERIFDEPGRRMALLRDFLAGVDVPGDELHDLDCFHADTCEVHP